MSWLLKCGRGVKPHPTAPHCRPAKPWLASGQGAVGLTTLQVSASCETVFSHYCHEEVQRNSEDLRARSHASMDCSSGVDSAVATSLPLAAGLLCLNQSVHERARFLAQGSAEDHIFLPRQRSSQRVFALLGGRMG